MFFHQNFDAHFDIPIFFPKVRRPQQINECAWLDFCRIRHYHYLESGFFLYHKLFYTFSKYPFFVLIIPDSLFFHWKIYA